MTAYDFPDAPTLGQVYDKWTWNGSAWALTVIPPVTEPPVWKQWWGTQAEYDAITPKDPDTLYVVI